MGAVARGLAVLVGLSLMALATIRWRVKRTPPSGAREKTWEAVGLIYVGAAFIFVAQLAHAGTIETIGVGVGATAIGVAVIGA